MPGRGSRVPTAPPLRLPPRPARSLFGEESGPICFHSESLKIPFWRNEKRKARFPRPARWVLARARRRAGGWGSAPPPPSIIPSPPPNPSPSYSTLLRFPSSLLYSPTLLLSIPSPLPRTPSPTPAVPQPLSPASRPGRAHSHGRHTRGPSAEAQLNAGGGGGCPKLAFPRPSGARSGRGRTKGAGRGERRVCRGIDLQMRLCLRIKARRTPDPGLRPHRGPRRPRPDRHPEAYDPRAGACTRGCTAASSRGEAGPLA